MYTPETHERFLRVVERARERDVEDFDPLEARPVIAWYRENTSGGRVAFDKRRNTGS